MRSMKPTMPLSQSLTRSSHPCRRFPRIRLAGFIFLGALSGPSHADPPLAPIAGFQEIESIPFSFKQKGKPTLRYKSSRARVFYSLQPAEQYPESKPTFVFFNGGPSCATSNGLMSWNTRPKTMDPLTGRPQFLSVQLVGRFRCVPVIGRRPPLAGLSNAFGIAGL